MDEFHARGLKHAADGLIIDPSRLGLAGGAFVAMIFQASESIHQQGLSFIGTD
jgi:hypothetical protein